MNVKVLNFISTPIYIMAGNDIEPALPAPASVQGNIPETLILIEMQVIWKAEGEYAWVQKCILIFIVILDLIFLE